MRLGARVRDSCVQHLLAGPVTGLGLVTGESRVGINSKKRSSENLTFLSLFLLVDELHKKRKIVLKPTSPSLVVHLMPAVDVASLNSTHPSSRRPRHVEMVGSSKWPSFSTNPDLS